MSLAKIAAAAQRAATPVALAGLVCVVTLVGGFGSAVLQTTLVTILINVILVVGLYLFVGNSGVFSFGHIGFMAVGAYTAAMFRIPTETKRVLFPTLPHVQLGSATSTLLGGSVAAVAALVIAIPLMRLSGLVASLGTFAFLNIVYVVASNFDRVTGGSTGLTGVPTTTTPKTALVWVVLAIGVAWFFQQTSLCLRLRGSREDEPAARAVGIGVTGERTVAFVLSAFVTGVGGALFAQFFGTVSPSDFFITITFITVAMLVVGGRLSLSGAVLGAFFVSWLGEGLRQIESGLNIGPIHVGALPGLQQVAIALSMLLVLLLRPRGLTGGEEVTPALVWRTLASRRWWPRVRSVQRPRRTTLTRRLPRPSRAQPVVIRPSMPSRAEDAPATSPEGAEDRPPVLSVTNLSVRYGSISALKGITLEIVSREIVGLIGPNGAGKSTTLGAIAGFLAPTTGSIDFEGRSLLGESPERIVRRGIALVPEGRQIFGTLSVAENLQLGTTPLNDRAAIQQSLEEVLERFPILRTYYRSSAAKLSGGEQQQLAIGRALLSRPRLLLLDEPSLGLAPRMIEAVFEVLAQLRDSGATILLVEQNATGALDLADRTYVLRTGRIVKSGTREELLATTDFAAEYLGTV